MTDYSTIPAQHMKEGIKGYIKNGWQPGSFLYALLTNNFTMVVATADHINKRLLVDWASWISMELPHNCWGSEEKVEAWIKFRPDNKNED